MTTWQQARERARRAVTAPPARPRPLAEAETCLLAEDLVALTDLPSFDTAAMDGWAVAGPGPWRLSGTVLAGQLGAALADGQAAAIATGAPLPAGAGAVLRRERGRVTGDVLEGPPEALEPGTDTRPRGQECRAGDGLLPAGTVVSPAVLGLAAAAGYDVLLTVPRPRADVLVLGDELLDRGLPRDGRVRDALGPMLPAWLHHLGLATTPPRHVPDVAAVLAEAIADSPADLVVTTGGTAAGPADHLHRVLARLGAELVVDGVEVRPGHPMLLAVLPGGRPLVGLPGNPLAAVSGLLTLVEPVTRSLRGLPPRAECTRTLDAAVSGHPVDTRLVPVRGTTPLHHVGPAMLRGLAAADAMAVVPPGGARTGDGVQVLPVPWEL